jgi:hypothetical protein
MPNSGRLDRQCESQRELATVVALQLLNGERHLAAQFLQEVQAWY